MTTGLISNTKGRIVPIQNILKRTKQLDITVTSAQAGWATTYAKAVFYADSNGAWRMDFNLRGSFTVVGGGLTSLTVSIQSVKAATQAVSGWIGASPVGNHLYAYIATNGNNSDISIAASSNSNAEITYVSGTVYLTAEPTTYTTPANLEVPGDVVAYIPNADASNPGLLSTSAQTKTGLMTFADSVDIVQQPSACVYLSANATNQPLSTFNTIAFNVEERDAGGNFSGGTFTAPRTGAYLVCGSVRIAPGTNWTRTLVSIYKNGGEVKRCFDMSHVTVMVNELSMPYSAILSLAANDTITIRVWASGTGNYTINGGDTWACFQKLS